MIKSANFFLVTVGVYSYCSKIDISIIDNFDNTYYLNYMWRKMAGPNHLPIDSKLQIHQQNWVKFYTKILRYRC